MYACIIYFTPENHTELLELINSDIARIVDFQKDYVCLRTRKLWKLYWFNFRYRKFQRKFSYSELFGPHRNLVVSSFIANHYPYEIEPFDGYSDLLTVYFDNIKHVWKVKLALFLKK